MKLPDIETVAALVHDSWVVTKKSQGIASRMSESGEELMVAYDLLSELQKETDRVLVRTVYAAIEKAQDIDRLALFQSVLTDAKKMRDPFPDIS